jgi:carbon-monoxide dehydrogenase small subunit
VAKITVTVNGKAYTNDVDDRTLLVHYLRENLNLTGTHIGCRYQSMWGVCGDGEWQECQVVYHVGGTL